jgi:hypothetical protein
MRQIVLLALLTSFALGGFAQNHAPIKIQYYPAKPTVLPPLPDRAPIVDSTPEVTSTLVLANSISLPTTVTILVYSESGNIIT